MAPTALNFTVVGPMKDDVEALHKKHEKWLKDLEKKGKTPPEQALAAYVDPSVPNLSSLVLLAEADGKTMLLTGDARGDKILEGLELTGLLEQGDDSTLHVDLLKVPHHGSANNLDDRLLPSASPPTTTSSRATASTATRSASRSRCCWTARGDADYHHPPDLPDRRDRRRAQERLGQAADKEKNRKKKRPNTVVRPDWSPQEHSLAALLAAHPALANKIQVVAADKPHVIDLAEPLGDFWPSLAP